eukprot:gnl/Hemi2/21083_TR6998_c0_g2_i1.p3 gnl/Hemi2/21083_TR6998_c0_g2~~gnl/Hemi2/21083_TR6998_c0_g2_i1.p3  ORF type:complete len:205 (-),score=73.51 gnl/Hemi2/21083_TR6998_c0_g2_i1:52-666(-)
MAGHVLQVHRTSVQCQYTDGLSGAERDLQVCVPQITGDQQYLSQVGVGRKGDPGVPGLVFTRCPLLLEATHFRKIWDNHGAKHANKVFMAAFEVVPPNSDWVSLGSYFVGNPLVCPCDVPPTLNHRGLALCARAATAPGRIGRLIWNDKGTHSDKDLSIFEIVPATPDGVPLGAFVCVQSYHEPSDAWQREHLFVLHRAHLQGL